MAVGAQRLAALAGERQRRGVHEHNGQLTEQVAAPLEQPLFDDVLDAAGCKLAVGDGSRLLAQPCHRPVKVMQLQAVGTGDTQLKCSTTLLRRPKLTPRKSTA